MWFYPQLFAPKSFLRKIMEKLYENIVKMIYNIWIYNLRCKSEKT